MSKTFRRKNKLTESRYLHDHVVCQSRHGGVFLKREPLKAGTREYALAFWAYHGDSASGIYRPPKWFRQALNRTCRRQDEQRLLRTLNRGQFDVVDMPRVKDAGYIWF
ncbi:hypothetical protein [Burkholderia cenocepacia]|uniref:hypothetical protein n=1 Tax=Burkholderia cenocepacia TaxID=95486 RepID=UPI000761000C|nr:hypothetical protein [Burkholderia cenocepacia]KWU24757.1 hypothetical protein AS149_31935 [Burkholderia cenocepacia]